MTSIQHFDFDGNKFPVVQTDELPSGYGVAVATVCDHLGIATQKQQDRIERSPWSKGRTTIMVVRLPDTDRSRGYFLLDSDRFAMWMATTLDEDEKMQVSPTLTSSDGSARGSDPWLINESGLYSLILQGKDPGDPGVFSRLGLLSLLLHT